MALSVKERVSIPPTPREALLASLSKDFSSKGIRLTDFGNLSSSKADKVINASTVGARIDALLRENKTIGAGFTGEQETHFGITYSVTEQVVNGARRTEYKVVDSTSVSPGTFILAREQLLDGLIVQGQDSTLSVRTYSNGSDTIDVCVFTRANNNQAYVGRIPWDDDYKQHVAQKFGLVQS